MNPHHFAVEFFDQHRAQDDTVSFLLIGAILVALCYIIWSVAMVWIIVQSYREKTYGMPAVSTAFLGTLCGLCLIGPYVYPKLFYPKEQILLWLLWLFWAILCVILYAQYLIYGKKVAETESHFRGEYTGPEDAYKGMVDTAPRWRAGVDYFYKYAIVILILSALIQWTFLVFIQDFYINVTCQLVLLAMAAEYLRLAYNRPFCKGLSVKTGWMMAIGNACLYLGILVGGMEKAYPYFTHGYDFMYLVFFLVVALNVIYAIVLHKRDCERHATDAAAT